VSIEIVAFYKFPEQAYGARIGVVKDGEEYWKYHEEYDEDYNEDDDGFLGIVAAKMVNIFNESLRNSGFGEEEVSITELTDKLKAAKIEAMEKWK
jgi:hypothetical protein